MSRILIKHLLILLNFIVFISITISSNGQQVDALSSIEFKTYSESDGLTSDVVKSVYKDSYGFLWVGTLNGLNRFNGEDFTTYKKFLNDSLGLSSNQITAIMEDGSRNLWIGTDKGLNVYDRKRNKFTAFYENPSDERSITNNWVKDIFRDSKGRTWVLTQNGLNKILEVDGTFYFQSYYLKNHKNAFLDIDEDDYGNLWLGTWESGLVKFNPDTENFSVFLPELTRTYGLPGDKVERLLKLKNGLLVLGFADLGIYLFDPKTEQILPRNKQPEYANLFNIPPPIYSFANGVNGHLWIGTAQGLLCYDIMDKNVVYDGRPGETSTYDQPRRDQARIVYIDDQQIVWAGIGRTGLNQYTAERNKFAKWNIAIQSPDRYRDFITGVTYIHDEEIWLSSTDGLLHITADGKVINRYTFNQLDQPTGQFIRDITMDASGYLWLATINGAIQFDTTLRKEIFRLETSAFDQMLDNSVSRVVPGSENQLWLVSEKGIQLFDTETKEFLNHPICERYQVPLIFNFYRDNEGDYWISGNGIVTFYDSKSSEFRTLNEGPAYTNNLSNDDVESFYQDSEGNIWIGSTGGLNLLDKDTWTITHYYKQDGLQSDLIKNIIEDRNGNMWVLTYSGLSKINKRNGSIINFNREDGLDPSILQISSTPHGNILMLGEKQITYFPPGAIFRNKYKPPIYLTNLEINGVAYNRLESSISESTIELTKNLSLGHTHRIINLTFSALNYILPEKNHYAYQLEGFNENWVDLGTDNEITLMNIEPGEYTLNVKASNNDLVWNDEVLNIQITMSPPWYKSIWAILLYFMAAIALFFGIYRYLINREKLKSRFEIERSNAEKKYEIEKLQFKKEHELDQLKLKFFFDISHEFKTPLTLILGPISNLITKSKENSELIETYELIRDNARRLEELISQLLDVRKLEIGKSKDRLLTEQLKPFLQTLTISFTDLAHRKNIDFESILNVQDGLYYYDRDKLHKVISNLLSNAIKFTPENKKVRFEVTIHEAKVFDNLQSRLANSAERITKTDAKLLQSNYILHIRVEDEGEGIPSSEIAKIFDRFYQVKTKNQHRYSGTGIGLSLTKEMVEIENGELYVSSVEEKGTRFDLIFPLMKEAKDNEEVAETVILNEQRHDDEEAQQKPMILIVEDNPDIAKFIEQLFREDFQIKKAFNGREGLEKAQKYQPDLILSDIMMPGTDGYQFCRSLKEVEGLRNIPIIVLTAKNNEDSIKSFLSLGVDDYVTKPFNSDLLIARAERLVRSRKNLRKAYKTTETITPDIDLINRDEQFLQNAVALVEKNLANPDFDKSTFAKEMGISQSQLYKRLHGLTNQSSNEFVRNIRLNKAAYILSKGTSLQIAEVGYMVGFSDPNYFTRKFKQYFGKTPSQYAQEIEDKNFADT